MIKKYTFLLLSTFLLSCNVCWAKNHKDYCPKTLGEISGNWQALSKEDGKADSARAANPQFIGFASHDRFSHFVKNNSGAPYFTHFFWRSTGENTQGYVYCYYNATLIDHSNALVGIKLLTSEKPRSSDQGWQATPLTYPTVCDGSRETCWFRLY